ncbi:hypothetical protein [Ketogulonicigenium robustum]|uniref:hypothetical protein n=1 Tax=Ketogulonicigenium robustum TaxID=92947 RepID=UPI000A269760|nr:hypothetical protein [Ketogulonicigenium robustum]
MNAPRSIFDADMAVRPARRPAPMPLSPRNEVVKPPRIEVEAPSAPEMNVAIPVTIRGVVYPSRKAAMRALHVSDKTLKSAEQSGRLDEVGMSPKLRFRISVGGHDYLTIAEAAAAIGGTKGGIAVAMRRGRALGVTHEEYLGYRIDWEAVE